MLYFLKKIAFNALSLDTFNVILLLLLLLLLVLVLVLSFSKNKSDNFRKNILLISLASLGTIVFLADHFYIFKNVEFQNALNHPRALGFICLVPFILSLSLNYSDEYRNENSLKLSGFFALVLLSVLADHWTCYLTSIFIIATSITSQDFLKTLAAIIFKNKEFFDLEISRLDPISREEKITTEQAIISESAEEAKKDESTINLQLHAGNNLSEPKESVSENQERAKESDLKAQTKSTEKTALNTEQNEDVPKLQLSLNKMRKNVVKAYEYEDKFFRMLELLSGNIVERNVRIKTRDRVFEVDGYERIQGGIKIYEVKYFAPGTSISATVVRRFLTQLESLMKGIEPSSSEKVKGELVLIGEFSPTLISLIKGLQGYSSTKVEIRVHSTSNIDDLLAKCDKN